MLGRIANEFFEAFSSRLFFFRARDPPDRRLSIGGRLSLKELPPGAVGPEASHLIREQLGRGPLLVRVDPGFSRAARPEGWTRPSFDSSWIRFWFAALQMLPGLRGENRIA